MKIKQACRINKTQLNDFVIRLSHKYVFEMDEPYDQ